MFHRPSIADPHPKRRDVTIPMSPLLRIHPPPEFDGHVDAPLEALAVAVEGLALAAGLTRLPCVAAVGGAAFGALDCVEGGLEGPEEGGGGGIGFEEGVGGWWRGWLLLLLLFLGGG